MYKDKHDPRLKESRMRWYRKNKDKQILRQMERAKENQKWLKDYKASLKCKNCPEGDPCCLDFHHRNTSEKEFDISQMTNNSRNRILQEIKKCDVLCANCHRKLHAHQKEQ